MNKRVCKGIIPALMLIMSMALLAGFSNCTTIPPSEEPEQVYKEDVPGGEIYYTQLDSAPFPHPKRRDGFTREGVFYPYNPHYSNSAVGIFVPEHFTPGRSIDLVYYFHGNFETIASAPNKFDLYRQFAESGVNALFIMPETAFNAPDNFGGKLEEPGGFERLTKDIIAYINGSGIGSESGLGKIVISGHSGAHRVMAKILDLDEHSRKIKEVILFDALFAEVEAFADWIGLFKNRLALVYTENGRTADNTRKLMELTEGILWKPKVVADEVSTEKRELQCKILIIQSPYDHYGVQFKTDQFRRLLASSRVLHQK